MEKYEILKFKDGKYELDVNVSPDEDTVWLTQEEIARLFEKDRSVITKHINNIFKENELEKMQYVQKMHELVRTGKKNWLK
ncbi:MAG: hypothetical protein MJ222_04790 [Bacilli bacterium]|nr:hypothetical protein [Bacilli bacterium]